MSNGKSLVISKNTNINRTTGSSESVFEQTRNQIPFSERLRLRRIERMKRKNLEQRQGISDVEVENMEMDHDLNSIINSANNHNTNPLIESLPDTEVVVRNESRDSTETADRVEEINESRGEEVNQSITGSREEDISLSIDINPVNDRISRRDLISPINLNDSTQYQDIVESLRQSNDHLNRAANLLELAQVQNRWILFGLGAGLVGIAGLSYWAGYRAGRLSALSSNNLLIINQSKRSLKLAWNLLTSKLKK